MNTKFEEIAIDEYQDSNLVQEYILTSVSRGNNIFMVGDVKQSIYRFRQAMPRLFLDKYNNYEKIELDETDRNVPINGRKIQLFLQIFQYIFLLHLFLLHFHFHLFLLIFLMQNVLYL